MARARKKPSVWPKLLLVGVVCLVAGAALALLLPGGAPVGERTSVPASASAPGSAPGPGPSAQQPSELGMSVAGLSRQALEDEVRRLEQIVAEKDAQITELTIQLKLARP